MADLIEVARSLSPYGVKGWIRVAPETDEELLLECTKWWFRGPRDAEPRPLEVGGVKPHGKGLIAKWKGCETPEEAQNWKGTILIDREDFPPLPEGEFWDEDLIGCRVVNKEGEELGTVETLETNGVQSLLAVKGEKRHLIPLIPEYVLDIDLDSELIQVEWHADWS